AGFNAKLLSLKKQDFVTAACGLKVIPDGRLHIKQKPSVLCVPGGGWLARSTSGAWAEAERGDVLQVIREFYAANVVLAAVWTGALLLARAGLLRDRPATTNHAAIDELSGCGAKLVKSRVVDDGDIITAGGITSSLDLGLWLIERFVGISKALEVANRLEYE